MQASVASGARFQTSTSIELGDPVSQARAESDSAGGAPEPFPFRLSRNGALDFSFDAFSRREPVSTPHQVRGRLSLENALIMRAQCNFPDDAVLDQAYPPFRRTVGEMGHVNVVAERVHPAK